MSEVTQGRTGRSWFAKIIFGLVQTALVAGFVVGTISAVRWLMDNQPSAPQRARAEPVYAVAATPAEKALNQPRIEVFGQVAERRAVELRTLVAGVVIEANEQLVAGERVAAGALIIRIDPFPYEGAVTEARANLAEARARLVEAEAQLAATGKDRDRAAEQKALAERDLERAKRLVAGRNVAERTVDDRELILSQRGQTLDGAESTLTVQRARIEQQRAVVDRLEWRLAQAERNLSDTTLRAPFDAVVRREAVGVGKRIGVSDFVAELYEADALDVRFTLSDGQFGRLREDDAPLIGRKVDLVWNVGGSPVRATARIDRIGADVSAATGGVTVLARVEAAADTPLRPGAFVTVALPDRRFADSFRLPETALYDDAYVFALIEEKNEAGEAIWRLSRREATPLAWTEGDVLLSGALDGLMILTSRLAEAGEGVRVRPLNAARSDVDTAPDEARTTARGRVPS